MGQIFSWFRGSQDTPALQDVAVEQQSQAKQPTTPTPAVPVSTVKPAEYEKGATSTSTAGSAAKPGTTAASSATTAAPVSTAATVAAGVSTGAKVSGGAFTGTAVSGAASNLGTLSGSSKVTPQAPPKAPPVSAGSGAASGIGGAGATSGGAGAGKPIVDSVKPKDASKDKPQSTITLSSKTEPPKVTSSEVGSTAKKDDAKSKSAKVQVEVPPPSAKASAPATAVDPFDALAGSLPPSEPLAPKAPQYTGPEVKERGLTSEVANRCGDRDDTLPPGYRKEDMEKKSPARIPEKPKAVSKPLTDDEALASLSAGFVSSAVPSAPKSQVTPPISSAKAPSVSAGSGIGGAGATGGVGAGKPTAEPVKPKDASKDKVQSTAISSSKPEPSKVMSTGVAKPSAISHFPGSTAQTDDTKSKGVKVQGEVPPPGTKASAPVLAVDPFDALAGSLPPSEPLASKSPQYTGAEVIEPGLTAAVANRCGDRDDTLPPGYRKKDMEKKCPAEIPQKPKEVSRPITEEKALDSLVCSAVSSAPKPDKKAGSVTAQLSHAPPPAQKRQEISVPTSVSPAPPADKKAKVEKGDSISLDALSALEDTLPAAKPPPESPKLRPEDIVDEKQATSEKGVRVGEREDTLPPEYRFSEEKLRERPAPPKEPSMDSAEALDILSGDFTSPSVAPAVQAPVPPSARAIQPKVEDLSALDALAIDFVAPAQAKKVASAVPPAPPPATKSSPATTTSKQVQGDPMSLDALSALGDTLPAAKPVPESPELRPEDIVDDVKLKSEKGVRVGERDDTLPPGYRFSEEDSKKYPAPPKREPSLDSAAALDLLMGDFGSPSVAPAVQAPVPPSAPPAESAGDFALEELADDFVAPKAASKVHSAVTAPPKPDRQMSEGTASAMDALSDTLMDITPVPEPVPVSPKDIVKEKQVLEEKVTKPGERDDTLPPEYRPTEADIKAAKEAKAKADVTHKQPSMDESAALDLLSSDFSTFAAPAVPVAPAPSHAQISPAKTAPTPSTHKAPGPVMDKLASTLLPDLPETKPKDSKPKVKGGKSKSKPKKPTVEDVPTTDNLSGQLSTDVVSTLPSKKGGKS